MIRHRLSFIVVALALVFCAHPVLAAPASFFEGKTVRIIVGLSAGGGYDLWARMIGRHLGRNIPGNPTVIVDNMTGAGSMTFSGTSYTGTNKMAMKQGNQTMNMTMNYAGKHLGPCKK